MANDDRDFMQGIPVSFAGMDDAREQVNEFLGVEIAAIDRDPRIYRLRQRFIEMAKEQGKKHAEEKLTDAQMQDIARDMQRKGFVVLSEKARQKMGNASGRGAGSKLDHQPGKEG